MTGFQVKVRDNRGNIHDERWTCDKSVAERIAEELPRTDWRVAEAWVEEDVTPNA